MTVGAHSTGTSFSQPPVSGIESMGSPTGPLSGLPSGLQSDWPIHATPPVLLRTPSDLHPALEEVRRMKEFAPEQPGLLDDLMKHPLLRQLANQLNQVLDQTLDNLRALLGKIRPPVIANLPDNMRDVLSGFVVFLMILLALYAFYLLLGWVLRRREWRKAAQKSLDPASEQTSLISSDYHYRQAASLAGAGHYEDAIRQLYLASLCLLDERDVVPFQAHRSNQEYLAALSLKHEVDLRTAFDRLSRQFEAARYGKRLVPGSEWQDCEKRYQHLEESTHG